MSRFRAYKSGGKWYVVTTDTNGLAGGPYDKPEEAQARVDRLTVLQEQEDRKAAQPPPGGMRITPGYRSPDVEDGRNVPGPAGPQFFPPQIARAIKWNGVPRGQVPADWGGQPAAAKHHIPIDPNDLNGEGIPFGEADARFRRDMERMWAEEAAKPTMPPLPTLPRPTFPPESWGDLRVRMGLPYTSGPKKKP